FTTYAPGKDLPVTAARSAVIDDQGNLWVAGYSRVVKRSGDRFETVISGDIMHGTVLAMMVDHAGTLWLAGSTGVIERTREGAIRIFGEREGLPDAIVRAVLSDRDGNLWAGTNNGIARLEHGRFISAPNADGGLVVRCLLEDREGNLWI